MKSIFKYASLLMAAVMLFSCQGTIDPEQGGENPDGPSEKPTPEKPTPEDLTLRIISDRNLVQTNVDVATITVTLGDDVLTEGVTFYDKDFNVIEMPDFKFVAKKAGDHVIWANYGTYESEEITIKAIDVPIPETPADPKPESTSFKTRVLMTEFTTVGCTACPGMKTLVHNALEDVAYADKVVLTACHPGLINSIPDPCYLHTTYDDFCRTNGYPTMNMDMYYSFSNYTIAVSEMKGMIDDFYASKETVAAGIAVNSSVDGEKLLIKATVKAAEDGNYRVGAFLVEDGIDAVQHGGTAKDWMNTHDGVIRYIDSKYGKDQYFGHSVGKVEKGRTADYVFDWDLDVIWSEGALKGEQYGNYYWDEFVMDNLHLVVFVSTLGTDDKGNQFYYVNNVIDCPVNGMTPYEYR